METTALLRELEPVVAGEVNRHLAVAKEWMPHEYVPWSLGRDYDGTPWSPEESTLSSIARTALEVNLLTEDNLPSYHREIDAAFGREGAWGTWTGRWTAEEGRHGLAIRDYLLTTRGVDPVQLERDRMAQMQHGYHSNDKNIFQVMAYVSFQELATRIAHRNTGRYSNDPVCDRLLARVATDENLHMIFYRNLVAATLEVDRSAMVQAIRDEVVGFQMPGAGMSDFARNSLTIAKAGIYDLRLHHDEVIMPVLKFWKVFDRTDLGPEGERARTELAAFVADLDTRASRFVEKREAQRARAAARSEA